MRFQWKMIACSAAAFAGVLLMVGCSVTPMASTSPTTSPVKPPAVPSTVAFKGVVHGGQNAVKNAQVYLLAVSGGGYGQRSTSRITSSPNPTGINGWDYVLTDSNGSFTIPTGTYGCSAGEQVYLYALSGDAFDQNGTILSQNMNSAIGLMAVLGVCGSSNGISPAIPGNIQLNEVTTVAAAYSLAGFATDATDMSSSGSTQAITGLNNAVLNARNLVDLSTGLVTQTPPTGVVLPSTMIYTIADILAACVNSQTSSSTACTKMKSDETYNSSVPGNTASAAINMAHQPGTNVSDLWNLSLASPPFSGNITALPGPSDFALAIGYSTGGLTSPTAIAIDADGNAWVTDTPTGSSGGLIELGPQGAALTPTNGYNCSGSMNAPSSLALGLIGSQTAWVASVSQGTVQAVSTATGGGGGNCTSVSPPNPTNCGGTGPWCFPIGIVASTSMYVLDEGAATLDQFDFNGNHMVQWPDTTAGDYNGTNFNFPTALAVDSPGAVWITDQGGLGVNANFDYVSAPDIDNINIATAGAPFGFGSDAAAIGQGQSEWVSDSGSNSVYMFTNAGTFLNSAFTNPTGGLDTPGTVAMDGAGNAWVVNAGGPNLGMSDIAEFAGDGSAALSPNGGYTANGLITNNSAPTGIAIDPSGNVWVSIQFDSSQVLQFIGLGVPTVTPVADAVADNTIALRP